LHTRFWFWTYIKWYTNLGKYFRSHHVNDNSVESFKLIIANQVLLFPFQHLQITFDYSGRCKLKSQWFDSIFDMLEHYRVHLLPVESARHSQITLGGYVNNLGMMNSKHEIKWKMLVNILPNRIEYRLKKWSNRTDTRREYTEGRT
jgi:hypothetical protein